MYRNLFFWGIIRVVLLPDSGSLKISLHEMVSHSIRSNHTAVLENYGNNSTGSMHFI